MRSDRERLLDILEATERIEKHTPEDQEGFDSNDLLQVWVIHHLQIIGEAANQLSESFLLEYPDVPWKKMIGMRHILVHGYFEIDSDIVWEAMVKDLPILKNQIQEILKNI